MPHYRFASQRTGILFVASVLVTALFLALPAVVGWAAPDKQPEREQVIIEFADGETEEPIDGLYCPWDVHAMTPQAWVCDGTSVQASSTEWTEAPEKTLRRQVRAYSISADGTEGSVTRFGDNLLYVYASKNPLWNGHTVAMTVRGTGEQDNTVQFVMVAGTNFHDVADLGAQIWEELTGTPLREDLLQGPGLAGAVPSDTGQPFVPRPRVRDL